MSHDDVDRLLESLGIDNNNSALVGGLLIRRNTEDPTLLSVDAWTDGISKSSAIAVFRDIIRTWQAEADAEISRQN
jgi:hypothetical protein